MNPDRSPRDQLIEIDITADGRLQITVGIDLLCHAFTHADWWPNGCRITDRDVLMRDLVAQLEIECSDTGLTPVQRMLDQAAIDAIDSGSEAFDG